MEQKYLELIQKLATAEAVRRQVAAIAERMKAADRFKSHDLGYPNAVEDWKVDDWADELLAALNGNLKE